MSRFPAIVSVCSLAALLSLPARADCQRAAVASSHVLVVKLVMTTGSTPYAFEPATTVAQRGDTVRFTEASGALHNVRFTKQAPGANLGAASTTPYLTSRGQTYDVVIDQRFAAGTYEFVCDPHAALGMKGTLVVK